MRLLSNFNTILVSLFYSHSVLIDRKNFDEYLWNERFLFAKVHDTDEAARKPIFQITCEECGEKFDPCFYTKETGYKVALRDHCSVENNCIDS